MHASTYCATVADDNGFGVFGKAYDNIIRCLGFKFNFSIFIDLPSHGGEQKKFPDMLPNYEAPYVPNMFFGKYNERK